MVERRRAEARQRLDDTAAGIEQLRPFVRDDDAGRPPRSEMAFDLLGEVMDVDHGGLDPGRGQPVEHVVEQWLSADRDERLRHALSDGTHADAVAGGQNHGGARNGRARDRGVRDNGARDSGSGGTHHRNLGRIGKVCAAKSTEI